MPVKSCEQITDRAPGTRLGRAQGESQALAQQGGSFFESRILFSFPKLPVFKAIRGFYHSHDLQLHLLNTGH